LVPRVIDGGTVEIEDGVHMRYIGKMMKAFLKGFTIAMVGGAAAMALVFFLPRLAGLFHFDKIRALASVDEPVIPRQKTKEELMSDALEKSGNVKALYMTADVANDPGAGATRLRDHIIALADTTEINGIVIDVKETCGPDYNEARLKGLIDQLHHKNIWAIARIVSFKDASQREIHPEWYLTRRTSKSAPDGCPSKHHLVAKNSEAATLHPILWQDNKGGYWMDPASQGARAYIAGVGRKMIDLGFDELQFDYVRFPSDGDVSEAQYPAWDGAIPRHEVMKSFFELLSENLKAYKPDIILSADLFGYVASQGADNTIGQRVADIGASFDYLSFMVYPSHYYNGLALPADPRNDLAAIDLSFSAARTHPDIVVGRSLQAAHDFLNPIVASSTATSSPALPARHARIRPWLEDFFHEADRVAHRPWGAEKVRLQIDAAEHVEPHGWMLWNASNVYTEGALKKE